MLIRRALLLVPPLAISVAIGCAPAHQGLPNAPIFNTGVRATIISPGQQAPAMPGQNTMNPTGTAPAYGTPYGGPYLGGPGAPPPGTPPSAYGNPNDLQMLGGAVTVDSYKIKQERGPLNNNPLLWPFAFVAWPFQKIANAVEGQDEQQVLDRRAQQIIENGGAPNYQTRNYQQRQLAHDQAQNDAMEQELAQRNAGAPQMHASAAPSAAPDSSIAAELEALRKQASAPPRSGGMAASPSAPGGADLVEDRNGDGRPDHWVYGKGGDKRREVFDDNGDGQPDRTVYYAPGGKEIQRVEQDTDGDGTVDSWTIYENGKMTQRRSDTNHDGQVDTWVFYDANGQIARQAQDLDGDGQRDRAEVYENGKLVQRTEDTDGDGRPDRITRFDAKGQPVETEEDKNHDGQIDVRSYYQAGKLVKRELLDGESQQATP